jgi:hypothetical protein
MANTRAAIKKADLKRIATAMREGGVKAYRVEVNPADGKFSVIVGRDSGAASADENDWDAHGQEA